MTSCVHEDMPPEWLIRLAIDRVWWAGHTAGTRAEEERARHRARGKPSGELPASSDPGRVPCSSEATDASEPSSLFKFGGENLNKPHPALLEAALEVAIALAEEGWCHAPEKCFREKYEADARLVELRRLAGVALDEPLPTAWAEELFKLSGTDASNGAAP